MTEPQYRLTVDLDGERISEQNLDDPFVTTTVDIDPRDVAAAAAGLKGITVVVRVDGTRAALAHVFKPMNLTPNTVGPVTLEGSTAGASPS